MVISGIQASSSGNLCSPVCFRGKQMRSVIVFQLGKGEYLPFFNRRMRCCNFLPLKSSKMCYQPKHKFAEKLEEIDRYGARRSSKLHNKVFALLDDNIPDPIGNGSGEKKSEMNMKDTLLDDLGISLKWKRFSSITLGSAPRVDLFDLYDGSTSNSETRNILARDDFQQYVFDCVFGLAKLF